MIAVSLARAAKAKQNPAAAHICLRREGSGSERRKSRAHNGGQA